MEIDIYGSLEFVVHVSCVVRLQVVALSLTIFALQTKVSGAIDETSRLSFNVFSFHKMAVELAA